MIKKLNKYALFSILAITSSSALSALEIQSNIRDSVEAELSKACVTNWAKTREGTGTLTTVYLDDQGDRFRVMANAMVNTRAPSGQRYPEYVSGIDIFCNVTGEEQIVINYRQHKLDKSKQKDTERKLNASCLKGFEHSYSNYIKKKGKFLRGASAYGLTEKSKDKRIMGVSAYWNWDGQKLNDIEAKIKVTCTVDGKFKSFRTIKSK